MRDVNNSFIITQADYPLQPVTFTPVFGESSPRAVVAINGKRYVPTLVEINGNAHGATGDATITLPIEGNPDFTQELFRGDSDSPGSLPISDNSPVYVQIFAGFPSELHAGSTDISQLKRKFFGEVDQYSAEFHDGQVTFTCRSLASSLVRDNVTRLTLNETSIQFASAAAKNIGLKFVSNLVSKPITMQEVLAAEFIGGSNFAAAIHKMKVWDLLLQAAMFDDVDVWVDQDTLHYEAPSLVDRQTVDVQYGRDILLQGGLVGTHSPQFSKNIQVAVHTYQRKLRKSTGARVSTLKDGGIKTTTFSRKVSSTPIFGTPDTVSTSTDAKGNVTVTSSSGSGGGFSTATSPGSESGKEKYVRFVANLSPDRCVQLAQSMWREISQHEFAIEVAIAMTRENFDKLDITSLLRLSGIPYKSFNTTYYPRKQKLTIDNAAGGTYSFTAVNHLLPQGAV